MKTNTFYKPKNEFGHELASKVYVDAKDNAIYEYVDQEIAEVDGRIDQEVEKRHEEHAAIRGEITDLSSKVDSNKTELENRRTIRTEEVPDGFNSVVSYIKSKWQNTSINERAQLHTELGQTIYLLPGTDDATTYEEYVCKNPDCVITEVDPDVKMVRLGAVDSIYAKVDAYGSVRLIEDLSTSDAINEATEWDDINEKRIAKTGYAVAPVALLSYWQKDKNLQEQIDSNKKEIERLDAAADELYEQITREYTAADDEIISRIKDIEGELQGTGENEQITGSRIDYLYDVIGLNGCCPNCGNESCTCDHDCTKLDCSIFCKIHNLDERLQENTESDVMLQSRLDDAEGRIEYNANLISNCTNAIGTGRDTRTDNTIRGRLLDLALIDGENKKELTDLVNTTSEELFNKLTNDYKDYTLDTVLKSDENVRRFIDGECAKLSTSIEVEKNARVTDYINVNDRISDVSNNLIIKLNEETENRKAAITDVEKYIDDEIVGLSTSIEKDITTAKEEVLSASTKYTDDEISKLEGVVTKNKTDLDGAISNLSSELNSKIDNGFIAQEKTIDDKFSQYIKDTNDLVSGHISNLSGKVAELETKHDDEKEELDALIEANRNDIDAHTVALATLASYPRILTISTEINSQNGGIVEIPYTTLINKIYSAIELQTINRGNIEAIVNSAKLTDDGNTMYEQAHPEITYIGEYSANGPADNRKVRVVFADADSVAHHVVISVTLYTNNSQTSMLYL